MKRFQRGMAFLAVCALLLCACAYADSLADWAARYNAAAASAGLAPIADVQNIGDGAYGISLDDGGMLAIASDDSTIGGVIITGISARDKLALVCGAALYACDSTRTIAAAMELYQRGLITDADCDGVPLKWGSKEAIVTWTEWMGTSKNALAKLMADGSYRLCEHYGMPELSMSVKKQEIPAYDARAIQGIGITYATSNRGGCHVRGYMISPEVLGLPEQLDRTTAEGKAEWAKIFQDLTAVIDAMGMCLFSSFALGAPEYAALLNAGTGTNYDINGLLEVGDRIYNLERMFNKAAGMKPEDDRLPKRIGEEKIVNGPSEGMSSQIKLTLPQYYEARGWKEAFPTEETLKRLGLEDLIELL